MNQSEYNEVSARVSRLESVLNGGKGSGNFGHKGRPGEVGGSGDGLGGILDETGHGIQPKDSELREIWNDFDDNVLMSDSDKKLLKTFYFGSWFFRNVQNTARGKNPDIMSKWEKEKSQEVIETLDDYLDSSSLDKDITLYRGIALNDENAKLLKKGSVISDLGFASTTINPAEATRNRHEGNYGSKRNTIILKINAKKGSRGLKSPVNADNTEYEVVLPRNSRFKVKSMSKWQRIYQTFDDYKYENRRVRVVEVDYE